MGDRKKPSDSTSASKANKKKTEKDNEVVKKPAHDEPAIDENDNFGGLPGRDLRKNLGCGG